MHPKNCMKTTFPPTNLLKNAQQSADNRSQNIFAYTKIALQMTIVLKKYLTHQLTFSDV